MAHIDFESINPFRTPDWRYVRVKGLLGTADQPKRPHRLDDNAIVRLREFCMAYHHINSDEDRDYLGYKYPGIYFAYMLHENEQTPLGKHRVLALKARILANQPAEQIAKLMGTIPESIIAYEEMFFDVRDRLEAGDWIADSVLIPAFQAQHSPAKTKRKKGEIVEEENLVDPFCDSSLLFFAFYGGVLMVEAMVTGFSRNILHDELAADDWLNRHWNTMLRKRSAAAIGIFNINRYNVMKLFETHAALAQAARDEENQQTQHAQMLSQLRALSKELKLTAGAEGALRVANTPLQIYDDSAVELRDSELVPVALGRKLLTLDGMERKLLPLPREMQAAKDNLPKEKP